MTCKSIREPSDPASVPFVESEEKAGKQSGTSLDLIAYSLSDSGFPAAGISVEVEDVVPLEQGTTRGPGEDRLDHGLSRTREEGRVRG